jgi:type I restriction-modification system DNA methylase subunit
VWDPAYKGSPQGERGGVHQFGVPPKGNANFAWVQHFIHHLAPQGMAGFVFEKMKRDTAIANFSLN